MTRPIAPGQTVPVPFTLAETPDATPTVAVYQSPADGPRSLIGSGTASVVDGLAYDATYTVPSDAEHGTAFHLLVSFTLAGETDSRWLDGGCVDTRLDAAVSSKASQTSVDNLQTEVNKIPRAGQTHTWTNADDATTANVTIS